MVVKKIRLSGKPQSVLISVLVVEGRFKTKCLETTVILLVLTYYSCDMVHVEPWLGLCCSVLACYWSSGRVVATVPLPHSASDRGTDLASFALSGSVLYFFGTRRLKKLILVLAPFFYNKLAQNTSGSFGTDNEKKTILNSLLGSLLYDKMFSCTGKLVHLFKST